MCYGIDAVSYVQIFFYNLSSYFELSLNETKHCIQFCPHPLKTQAKSASLNRLLWLLCKTHKILLIHYVTFTSLTPNICICLCFPSVCFWLVLFSFRPHFHFSALRRIINVHRDPEFPLSRVLYISVRPLLIYNYVVSLTALAATIFHPTFE